MKAQNHVGESTLNQPIVSLALRVRGAPRNSTRQSNGGKISRIGRLWFSVFAIAALVSAERCPAANITWQAPVTIAGDTDVVTTGIFKRTYHFTAGGLGSTTVNGVLFSEFAVPPNGASGGPFYSITVGNTTLTAAALSSGEVGGNNFFFSPSNPYASLSSSYKAMLASAAFITNDSKSLTLALNGLTAGPGGLRQLPARGSHRPERAQLTHSVPQVVSSLRCGAPCGSCASTA